MGGYCINCQKRVDCKCELLEKKYCNLQCKEEYLKKQYDTPKSEVLQQLPEPEGTSERDRLTSV